MDAFNLCVASINRTQESKQMLSKLANGVEITNEKKMGKKQ